MKNFLFLLAALLCFHITNAQQKPTDLDKSPLDVTYYPANYPILKMSGKSTADPLVRILYSRPQKKGRTIFGGEVKYNDVWRIGANESTEIEFFKNGMLGDKKVPKGRYSMFCIPTENKWTIILNKDNYCWGSFTYKSDKDVARMDVPVQKNTEEVEALTMYFENNGPAKLVILWDTTKAVVPISF
jgi:hypothetical protein